jgi:hypothetical protein
MSTRIQVGALNQSDKAILTFLLPKEWVGQEQIADHLTQSCGGMFDATNRPPMETLEKLSNLALIERNPRAGRQWGLSVDGDTLARQIQGVPKATKKASRAEAAAAKDATDDAGDNEAPASSDAPQREKYGKKRARTADATE